MSKSKKRKKSTPARAEEKAALRQERAEMRSKQNRKALLSLGGLIITGAILIAMLIAATHTKPARDDSYEELETGMTYTEAESIMGSKASRAADDNSGDLGEGTHTVYWDTDSGTVVVALRDGEITSVELKEAAE